MLSGEERRERRGEPKRARIVFCERLCVSGARRQGPRATTETGTRAGAKRARARPDSNAAARAERRAIEGEGGEGESLSQQQQATPLSLSPCAPARAHTRNGRRGQSRDWRRRMLEACPEVPSTEAQTEARPVGGWARDSPQGGARGRASDGLGGSAGRGHRERSLGEEGHCWFFGVIERRWGIV